MKFGSRYIVTRASKDREFQVGDRVELPEDGAVLNHVVGGWMSAEDVRAATRGMRVMVDAEWIPVRREKLEKELRGLA